MSAPRVRKTYRWQRTWLWARVLGWLLIGAQALFFVEVSIRLRRALSAVTVTGTGPEVRMYVMPVLRSPLALALGPVVIAAEVLWLIWQHKVNADLWARGVEGLRFTPGWSVGWWFVPFANLIQPFRAVRELSRRVGRTGSPGPVEPPAVGDGTLSAWWGSMLLHWLLTAPAFVILFRDVPLFRGSSPEAEATVRTVEASDLRSMTWWLFAAAAVRIISALLAARIVWSISRAEDAVLPLLEVPPRPDL